MADPLVWLPFDPDDLGEVPGGLRYEVVRPGEAVPDSAAEVEYYVQPYQFKAEDQHVMTRMSRLRVVQTLTAGTEHVAPYVPDGVTLCNGRGIHDASTSELALTLLLASLRGVPAMVHAQDRGEWAPAWSPALADRHVVVVGAGAIGQAVRARVEPFEARVTLVGRTAREGVRGTDDLPALLPDADAVVLVLPLTEESRGLVDAEFLGRMRDGAVLVNVARGGVVVTDDLVDALASGRIHAALDVTDPEPLPADHPLWRSPNLLLSPHVGGASSAMWPRAHRLVRDQLRRFAAGEPLANVVD